MCFYVFFRTGMCFLVFWIHTLLIIYHNNTITQFLSKWHHKLKKHKKHSWLKNTSGGGECPKYTWGKIQKIFFFFHAFLISGPKNTPKNLGSIYAGKTINIYSMIISIYFSPLFSPFLCRVCLYNTYVCRNVLYKTARFVCSTNPFKDYHEIRLNV